MYDKMYEEMLFLNGLRVVGRSRGLPHSRPIWADFEKLERHEKDVRRSLLDNDVLNSSQSLFWGCFRPTRLAGKS